jgi:phosphoribosylanthranilate isomerase
MLPFQIKICGVTNVDDTVWACKCGADAVGLNFYQRSKRFVDSKQASAIVSAIDGHNQEHGGGEKIGAKEIGVKKVGVFVEMPVTNLLDTVHRHGLDGIQLHGNEEPAVVEEIRSKLSENGQHCFLIRAIRSVPKELASSSESKRQTAKLSEEIAIWVKVGVDVILLDAAMPGEYGGTGKLVDITNISDLNSKVPMVLAGGLTPCNVEASIQRSGFSAVDVASGVESAPGLKDRKKVREFVHLAMKSFQEMK